MTTTIGPGRNVSGREAVSASAQRLLRCDGRHVAADKDRGGESGPAGADQDGGQGAAKHDGRCRYAKPSLEFGRNHIEKPYLPAREMPGVKIAASGSDTSGHQHAFQSNLIGISSDCFGNGLLRKRMTEK